MSKWIYSPVDKIYFNLDKAYKIVLKTNHILIEYEDDGCAHVEYESKKEMMEAWEDLNRLIK